MVVEERYSRALRHGVVRGSVIADGLAECQVNFPNVPIMFCETRKLAQEWSYRFLASAMSAAALDVGGASVVESFAAAAPLGPRPATTPEIRAWARGQGLAVSDRGRIAADIVEAFRRAAGRP